MEIQSIMFARLLRSDTELEISNLLFKWVSWWFAQKHFDFNFPELESRKVQRDENFDATFDVINLKWMETSLMKTSGLV